MSLTMPSFILLDTVISLVMFYDYGKNWNS